MTKLTDSSHHCVNFSEDVNDPSLTLTNRPPTGSTKGQFNDQLCQSQEIWGAFEYSDNNSNLFISLSHLGHLEMTPTVSEFHITVHLLSLAPEEATNSLSGSHVQNIGVSNSQYHANGKISRTLANLKLDIEASIL